MKTIGSKTARRVDWAFLPRFRQYIDRERYCLQDQVFPSFENEMTIFCEELQGKRIEKELEKQFILEAPKNYSNYGLVLFIAGDLHQGKSSQWLKIARESGENQLSLFEDDLRKEILEFGHWLADRFDVLNEKLERINADLSSIRISE